MSKKNQTCHLGLPGLGFIDLGGSGGSWGVGPRGLWVSALGFVRSRAGGLMG